MKIIFDSEEQKDMFMKTMGYRLHACPKDIGLDDAYRCTELCSECVKNAFKKVSEVKERLHEDHI